VARKESDVRVSIVVPHLGDDTRFEDSLVSVLENRPADSEVWVAHDGRYDDPFDLSDEVQFITSDGGSLPELIAAVVDVARGRFVHILGGGVRATEGWVDNALEKFEHDDAAMVAPVARSSANGPITAAGWTSSSSRLSTPVAAGRSRLGRRDAASIRGVCLTASFWRREELRDACQALATTSISAAQFGWSRLLGQRGWRCLLAEESTVIGDEEMLGLRPSRNQGATLRSLEAELEGDSFAGSAVSVGLAAISNLFRPRVWGEITGEAMSLVLGSSAVRAIHPDVIRSPEECAQTIRLPQVAAQAPVLRRAA
jgi:hypothetical protein